jgi:hypothetical protein
MKMSAIDIAVPIVVDTREPSHSARIVLFTVIVNRCSEYNADDHPLMKRMHKPDDEKRMVVILAPDQYDDWLHCPAEEDGLRRGQQRRPTYGLPSLQSPRSGQIG